MPVLAVIAGIVILVIVFSNNASADSTGASCMTLSFAQLLQLAQNAGFDSDDAPTAAAIALAESSGRTAVIGDQQLGIQSVGLWQINLHAHPQYTVAMMQDPQQNANAAFAIYQGRGSFADWTTYNTGAYKKYLPTCCGGCNDCTCAG